MDQNAAHQNTLGNETIVKYNNSSNRYRSSDCFKRITKKSPMCDYVFQLMLQLRILLKGNCCNNNFVNSPSHPIWRVLENCIYCNSF